MVLSKRAVLRLCVVLVGFATFNVIAAYSQAAAPDASQAGHQKLFDLLKEEWDYEMQAHPQQATEEGDNRFNDRLGDVSPEFFQSDLEQHKKFLSRIKEIPESSLSSEDVLNRKLILRWLQLQIDRVQFKPWEMPVNQMDGPHLSLLETVTLTPFNTITDYDHYISRLHQLPRLFDQVTANMRQGMKDKLMPPRYLLEKVAVEAAEIGDKTGDASPFAGPLQKFPSQISVAEQSRVRTQILDIINNEVVPTYKKFAVFVRDEYAPQGRTEPGVWALPDGEARYRFAVREMTTTDLTPDQIHEIGLKQLAKDEADMLALAHKLGYKDLASFNEHIKNDRSLYGTSGQQFLDLYTKYARQMEAKLPQEFHLLPKNKLEVIPMDPFRSKDAVPADYTPGASDGSRPGHINVNEYDPQHRLVLNVEAIAYHEGVPGHHLQISIGQEIPGLPDFRRNGDYTAFIEGWALYSERLGKEMGFYQDPYSDYGRLENEMWRDIRLVIDTGVHEKHWTRDQMVEYFHRYTAMDEQNVQSEVDRYIAWPGQALAYKLGQLEILKLREEARQKFGTKFDIRMFHDQIVGSGPLPLDVLDSKVEAWIAQQAKQ